MAANNPETYSTLEYVPPTEHYNKKENALPVYSGLQVVPETGKHQAHVTSDGIEIVPKHDGPFLGIGDADYIEPPAEPAKSRRKWLIVGGVILLLAIIGGVVGGVMASKSKNSTSASGANSSGADGSTGGSGTSSASPKSTTSSAGSAKPTSANQPKRNIAAVSWNATPNNQTRLYFQNNAGEIIEAVAAGSKTISSALEANKGAALVKDGKPGSPLAAAVTRPGFAFLISVFYLDADNVIHDLVYERAAGTWSAGAISSKGYKAAANSSLAAMYNQCRYCANTTILAFQDENNFLQIANRTLTGWQVTQVNLNQLENTGLGLQPYYWAGQEDQLDLFYQRKDRKMAMASWVSSDRTNKPPVWAADQLWSESPANVPIAAASSYHNVTSGTESWIQVLSTAETGLVVSTWDGAQRNWDLIASQQSAFSNVSSPKTFDSLAVTAAGAVFASVSTNGTSYIESWQLQDDWINWKSAGPVPIKEAWN